MTCCLSACAVPIPRVFVLFMLVFGAEQSGSRYPELALEFHKCWGAESARVVLRCILEDVLQDQDFFLDNAQYALAEHVHHEVRHVL